MSKRPWMPFYVNDYLGDTTLLTLEEHGAYLLLLCYYWNHANAPANAGLLHKICRCTNDAERHACDSVVAQFFVRDGDVLKNRRLDEELEKAGDISEKRAKAALVKHANALAKADANASANAEQMQSQSQSQSHKQEQEPTSTSTPDAAAPPVEEAKEPPVKKYEPGKDPLYGLEFFPAAFQTKEFEAVWAKWVAHRKDKKSALHTLKTAAKEQIAKLVEIGPENAMRCLSESLEKGWLGVFPERLKRGRSAVPDSQPNYDQAFGGVNMLRGDEFEEEGP